jgi:hypothetical protein
MRDQVSASTAEGLVDVASASGRHRAPARPDPAGCDLYRPGHQMHYRHQGVALRSPATPARFVSVDGVDLTIELEDGRVLHWRHHDPVRLGRLLDLVPGSRVAHLREHAFRVGPYWFNCAPADVPWVDCTGT